MGQLRPPGTVERVSQMPDLRTALHQHPTAQPFGTYAQRTFTVPWVPGATGWNPSGFRFRERIRQVAAGAMRAAGFRQLELPILQPERWLATSGRLSTFADEIYRLPEDRMLLSPTYEEAWLEYLRSLTPRQEDLPVMLFQIGPKFRRVPRPKPLNRLIEFEMLDGVSLCRDAEQLLDVSHRFSEAVDAVAETLSLPIHRVEKGDGDYVDFCTPSAHGEMRIVPNGTGPWRYADKLERETAMRASSIGMYMEHDLRSVVAPVASADGGAAQPAPYLGSYGFGIDRLAVAVLERIHAVTTSAWPRGVAPFDLGFIVVGAREPAGMALLTKVADSIATAGFNILVDDRPLTSPRPRRAALRYVGCRAVTCWGQREEGGAPLEIDRFDQQVCVGQRHLLEEPGSYL